MVKRLVWSVSLLSALLLGGCSSGSDDPSGNEGGGDAPELPGKLDPVSVTKTNSMKVYIHYMPWFETPQTSDTGRWGWHWTMNTCNPDNVQNGKRQIASHYYPAIGPYASSDPTVLNYHALLMKYAGADGIMIDWYGIQEKNDYPLNRRNTEEAVKAMERVGLEFSIVYEDATLDGLDDKATQALKDMNYLQRNFFGKSNYTKVDNRPLLLVFGPQQLIGADNWKKAFGALSTQPELVVLNGHGGKAGEAASGEYLWVNPQPDYSVAAGHSIYIGGAMPGFHDYYREGGAGDGYTTYDDENGQLFDRQLNAAKSAGLKYLQISTWNDFGEGTNIEPTMEYGNRYLLKLQQFTGVPYDESALKTIQKWYSLRTKYSAADKEKDAWLTQAFYYLVALQPDKAAELLNLIEKE